MSAKVSRIGYLVIALLLIGWELQESRAIKGNNCELRTSKSVEGPVMEYAYDHIYPYVVLMANLKPATNVSVVSIEADLGRVQANVCQARKLMGELLEAAADRGAQVIAIDKFYGANSCTPDDPDTKSLINTIASLHNMYGPVPVVVGASTSESKQNNASSCLVLDPQLFTPIHGFGSKAKAGEATVYTGLTRLNEDPLKIPLTWPIFLPGEGPARGENGQKSLGRNGTSDGFALVATRVMDWDATRSADFQRILGSSQQPYADITHELNEQTATNLLCSTHPEKKEYLRKQWGMDCSSIVVSHPDLERSVVVIGAESPTDNWPVPNGEMYGFKLQAHYIADLLGNGYLQDISGWLLVAALAVYFSLTELLLPYLHFQDQPAFGLRHIEKEQRWQVGLFCLTMLIGFFLPLHLGYFPPLTLMLAVTTIFITRRLIEWWGRLNETKNT